MSADPGTDLIVTHFFLDCLTQHEVNTLAARLAGQVSAGCLWVISDFGLPRQRLLQPLAAGYIRLLYLAFRLLTGLRVQQLPDSPQALRAAGFTRLQRTERLQGLLYSEIWQLRRPAPATRDSGATSAQANTSTYK